MRRSLSFRLLAAWLACWLPLVLADGGWLHACPMHAPGSRPSASETMSAAMAAGQAMAMHAAAHDTGGHHGSHACTCDGTCCAPMAALAAVEPIVLTVGDDARLAVPTAARSDAEYVAAWVDFVLPFATAPPVARANA